MIAFLAAFLRLFFLALGSKRDVLTRNVLLKKENEILLWRLGKRRVQFGVYDKRSTSPSITLSDRIREAADLAAR
jgi:hypothetical protein